MLKVSKSRKQIMVSSILPKNEQTKFNLRYHSTVRLNFFHFLGELRIPEIAFEIFWPLVLTFFVNIFLNLKKKVLYYPYCYTAHKDFLALPDLQKLRNIRKPTREHIFLMTTYQVNGHLCHKRNDHSICYFFNNPEEFAFDGFSAYFLL